MFRLTCIPSISLGALLLTAAVAHAGTPLEPGFTETQFVASNNIGNATRLGWAPDGSNRLFVTRQNGEVRVVKNGAVLATPFATISPISTSGESGLLGMAFDPDFIANRYVYFFVTVSASEQQIIRYTDVNDVGQNKTTIVGGLPNASGIHVGGGLATSPDGHLFWAIGDNFNPKTGVDSNLTSLASKVGRARLNGTVPNDNPFNDGVGPNNDYVWARGFRNPYSVRWNPFTNRLWVSSCGDRYEQLWTLSAGDHAGWDDWEANQPPGFVRPVFKYRTGGTDSRTVVSATRTNGVTTFTLDGTGGQGNVGWFSPGERVTISGSSNASFNGTFYAGAHPTWTSFTVPQPGPDGTGTGGTITTQSYGNCVTGGGFYDGTLFPPAYRGNYFAADFVAGRLTRVAANASSVVTRADRFLDGLPGAIDVATGPDAALYYLSRNSYGVVYRLSYGHTAQAIALTPTNLNLREGSTGVVTVRLAVQPSANVTVNAAVTGSSSVTVSPPQLTFTAQNWQTPQVLTVISAQDADSNNEQATLTLSSSAASSEPVTVRVFDDDGQGFVVSTTALTITEGQTGTFTVRLSQAPSANVTVTSARTAGDPSVSVTGGGSLTFTPQNFATPQTVTVTAAADADFTTDQATITVSAPGYTSRDVEITATDVDGSPPAITSMPPLTAVAGATWRYTVTVSGNPSPGLSLQNAPQGMTLDAPSRTLQWTPTAPGTGNVSIVASNGQLPNATQSFAVTVSADMPPTAQLTLPMEGDTVSGTEAEFFGDGFDDVGTVRGDFYVDDTLVFTDTTPGGHYHVNGEHQRWDTTLLSDGPHTVRLVVTDTAGQTDSVEVNVIVANGTGTDAGMGDDAGMGGDDAGTDAGMTGDDGGMTAEDAGTMPDDAGVTDDAGTVTDGGGGPKGEPPAVTGSCGCASGAEGGAGLMFTLVLGAGVLVRRPRSRRACA